MLVRAQSQRLTAAEYLELEQVYQASPPYLVGNVDEFATFDFEHKLITSNIYVYLQLKLWDLYKIFAEPKVEIAALDRLYTPDIAVVDTQKNCCSSSNLGLIIEVKSSLERVNCPEKWLAYQNLVSLQEYAIVSQDQFLVEVYRRDSLNQWQLEIYTLGDSLQLNFVELNLTIKQIYEDVSF